MLLQDADELLFGKTATPHALVLELGQSELQTGSGRGATSLGQAHRFREMLLREDGSTMAELAKEAGVTPFWFSRIIRPGFLSLRIVTAIIDGTQLLELSADRPSKAGPVSSAWPEQLSTYGFV